MSFRGVVLQAAPPEGGGCDSEVHEVSRVDVHETTSVQILNAMNEGIRSLGEVDFRAYGIARPSTLLSLSLHSNRVSSLEGLSSMTVSLLGAFGCAVCRR